MITITTTITDKDGVIEVTSQGKVTPDGTEPSKAEATVANLLSGTIAAATRAISGQGCGECEACKEEANKGNGSKPATPFAMAAPILLKDKVPSA